MARARSSKGAKSSGPAVEESPDLRVCPKPEQVIDAVFDEDEIALLTAIGICRGVRLEEPNLTGLDDLAVSMPHHARHRSLMGLARAIHVEELEPTPAWRRRESFRDSSPDHKSKSFLLLP
jgi:hypothetical protein